jgi:hypothetical protein
MFCIRYTALDHAREFWAFAYEHTHLISYL